MESNKIQPDRDIICPVCFKQVAPAVMEPEHHAEGIRRRSYSAWCPGCSHTGQGYIVIQFYHGGRWRIEKYIPIKPLYVYDGPWQKVGEVLPVEQEIPVIETGPGGDFTRAVSDDQLAAAIATYKETQEKMLACGHTILDLLLLRKSV